MKKYFNFILAFALIIFAPLLFVACDNGEYYTITVAQMTNGTIQADKTQAREGETVNITVTPDDGFKLKDNTLKFNSNVVENLQFTMPAQNVVLSCEFMDKLLFLITINQTANGTIYIDKTEARSGELIDVVITPNVGCSLEENSLKYNNTLIEDFQFEMPDENVVISANFVLKTYYINYNVNEWTENSNPTSFNVNTPSITLLPPVRKGFDFNGWYLDEEFQENITQIEQGTAKDFNLYPKFNQIFELSETGSNIIISDLTAYGDTLQELVVPSSIDGKAIFEFAIQRACNNVVTLTIEDGIQYINPYLTLYNSQNLETVNLPKSIRLFVEGGSLFRNCEKLTTINVEDGNNALFLQDGVLYQKIYAALYQEIYIFNYLVCYPNGLTRQTLTIPENITHITNFGKAKFNKVVIPSTVIEFCSFEGNKNPFSECEFLNCVEISPNNEHFFQYNDAIFEDISDSANSDETTTNSAKLIHVLNTGRLNYDLDQEIIKNETQKYNIADIEDRAFDACVDLQYIITEKTIFNIRIFDNNPNLKAYITVTRPQLTDSFSIQRYEEIFNCQNIYWFSWTNMSNRYNCWHYVEGNITIWEN